MHLEKIRFCQEYFAIDTIVLPHIFFNCLYWGRRTLSCQFLSTQHFKKPFPFNQPKHGRMFWKCSPTANGFECPVSSILGSASGALFLWDHQYKCILENYEVRLVCARINTIQETAWNKESTKTKGVLLEHEAAIKWNTTDESKVQENYSSKKCFFQSSGVREEQMPFTIYYLIFGLSNPNQSSKYYHRSKTTFMKHLWKAVHTLLERIQHKKKLS